jgi:hypothetical protein
MMLLSMTGAEPERQYIPPPAGAELPEKVQLVSVGEDDWLQVMPPPLELAELYENEHCVSVGEDRKQFIPPPSPAVASLSEKAQSVRIGEDCPQYIAPPSIAEFPEKTHVAMLGFAEPKQYTAPPL